MHIEPGIVDGTKIILSYAAAAVPCGYAVKLAAETIVVEPLVDLGVLAIAKSLRGTFDGAFVTRPRALAGCPRPTMPCSHSR